MFRRKSTKASGAAAVSIGGDSFAPVTTTYIGTQVLDKSSVPLAAVVRDPRLVFAAVSVETFTGREWLANEVDSFMAAYPCGYVFVEAEAGLGKTAFAAWLVKTRGYLSHFSRYSDGRSAQAALGNLSAQLITKLGLEYQVPGGMLPEWARTPGGFESLLTTAIASAQEQSLVLVVDGLDEADAPAEDLPFGLPSLLPDGVFVIGTYRTGRPPKRPDAPSATLQIAQRDPRNWRDLREYLARAVNEEVLAARLAAAGADQADFCGLLAERCGGVWIYLRYVLDELRLGLRRPDEISDLPVGLRGFYADQIRRWQQDKAWHTGLLPLLATLGVAGEALPILSLARLAGHVDCEAVRSWCDLALRPMLTTTRTPPAGTPLRYEIYHASLRELLNASHDDRPTLLDDQQPHDLLALAEELRQATVVAHHRICDIYLADFGGLNAGLSDLAEDPGLAGVDGGYPLRNLARHLCHAHRAADLHQLLAAEHATSGNHAVNTWFAAHDRADSIMSYQADLAEARNDSAVTTNRDLSRGRLAPTLGMEIRYALMSATAASLARYIPSDLLRQLLEAGVWPLRRALDHARRILDPRGRLDALLVICGQVIAEEQHTILGQALAAATAITDDFSRAQGLTELALHLPDDERPDVLAQALAAVTALTNDRSRREALAGLAPRLPAALFPQALASAIAIPNHFIRAATLAELAPHLPADLLPQALAAALAMPADSSREEALKGLAPHLTPDLLPQALAAASAADHFHRVEVLAALAPHLPDVEQPAALGQALAAATAITDDARRAHALAKLAPSLPDDQRPDVIAQALATATATAHDLSSGMALAELAPYLPPELIPQALAAAVTADDMSRALVLASLAPYMPPDLLPQALAAATAITHTMFLGLALAGLARHLPPDLLPEALTAATNVTSDSDRARILVLLAPQLPPDLLPQAMASVAAIRRDSDRAQALTELAPHLPNDERPGVLAQALAAATIADKFSHAQALTALAPYLPDDERPDVLAQALAAAAAITDNSDRAQALTELAPHLPDDDRPDVLAQALAAATAITDDSDRAQALAGLAPDLPPDLLAQALAAATGIRDGNVRTQALTELAPHLPPDLLAQALAPATVDNFFGNSLAALAPHLPPDLLPQALAAATAFANHWVGDHMALTALAPHLPPDLLPQALAAATAIEGDSSRSSVLAALAPHLPTDLLPQALAAATAITSDGSRAEVLAALAPHLPDDERPGVLAQALAAASGATYSSDRARALTALVPHLPDDEQPGVLVQALAAATTSPFRYGMLAALAPHLPPEMLSRALTAAATADDSGLAQDLTGLAPYLPPEMLSRALTAASAITSSSGRAQALTGLAPYLQPELLSRALTAAAAIASDAGRARALAGLIPQLPPDLLHQAVTAVPQTSRETLIMVLRRAQETLTRDTYSRYVVVLRECLDLADRRICSGIVKVAAPTIAEIGGAGAIEQCTRAEMDACRWWQ